MFKVICLYVYKQIKHQKTPTQICLEHIYCCKGSSEAVKPENGQKSIHVKNVMVPHNQDELFRIKAMDNIQGSGRFAHILNLYLARICHGSDVVFKNVGHF